MIRASAALDRLLALYPNNRTALLPYIERAKHLSNECGCAHGAVFVLVAFAGAIAYFVVSPPMAFSVLGVHLLLAGLFIFASGMVGKLIGIGIARVRLMVLTRQLSGMLRGQGA